MLIGEGCHTLSIDCGPLQQGIFQQYRSSVDESQSYHIWKGRQWRAGGGIPIWTASYRQKGELRFDCLYIPKAL